jgi:hypothetical protein
MMQDVVKHLWTTSNTDKFPAFAVSDDLHNYVRDLKHQKGKNGQQALP